MPPSGRPCSLCKSYFNAKESWKELCYECYSVCNVLKYDISDLFKFIEICTDNTNIHDIKNILIDMQYSEFLKQNDVNISINEFYKNRGKNDSIYVEQVRDEDNFFLMIQNEK